MLHAIQIFPSYITQHIRHCAHFFYSCVSISDFLLIFLLANCFFRAPVLFHEKSLIEDFKVSVNQKFASSTKSLQNSIYP